MSLDNNQVSGVPTASDTTQTPRSTAKGILCAKCQHVNRPGSTTCSVCNSHLHIKCNDCGAVNERAIDSCRICGRSLHRSAARRLLSRLSTKRNRIKPTFILLMFAVVGVIFFLVVKVTQIELPVTR
jgi:hypothetical protein